MSDMSDPSAVATAVAPQPPSVPRRGSAPAHAIESTDVGTHVATDPVQQADGTSLSSKIIAGLLFVAGGLFGLVKLYLYQFEGCRASGEGLGFHPLGWSSAMSFMCTYSWQSSIPADGWQVAGWGDMTAATVFLVAASLVLFVCGIVCLAAGRSAGITVGVLLSTFTLVSFVVAVIGMVQLNSSSQANWFDYGGGYFLCVQYLILLAIPMVFMSVMASTSMAALRSRRMLLIVAMGFGAVVFPALSVLLDFSVKPELGNILLISALLVLAYDVKDPAILTSKPRRQFGTVT